MKLTILGKNGAFQSSNGAMVGYLLQSEKANIMLDCGSGSVARLMEFIKPSDLDAIILSHLHYDHFCDILPLQYFNFGKKMPLFMPFNDCLQFDLLKDLSNFTPYCIDETKKYTIGDMTFTFKEMKHPIISYAIKVSDGKTNFVYSGDTQYNDKLVEFCKGANVALLDCLQINNTKTPHMTKQEGEKVGRLSGAKILATHKHPLYYEPVTTENIEEVEERKTYLV